MYLCDNCRKPFTAKEILPGQVEIEDDKIKRILLCNDCFISEQRQPGKVINPFEAGEDKRGKRTNLESTIFKKGADILEKIIGRSL